MRRCVLTLFCIVGLSTSPTLAQTAAPPVPHASGQATLKAVRKACREKGEVEALKGDAHRQAMMGCMTEAMPEKRARIACMFDPQTKGMDRDARRTFVKSCVAKSSG